jgi:hypothetical protein
MIIKYANTDPSKKNMQIPKFRECAYASMIFAHGNSGIIVNKTTIVLPPFT